MLVSVCFRVEDFCAPPANVLLPWCLLWLSVANTALVVEIFGRVVLCFEAYLVFDVRASALASCLGRGEQAVAVRGFGGMVVGLLGLGLDDVRRFSDSASCG